MKRSDFFKTLLAIPFISFVWNAKAKPITMTGYPYRSMTADILEIHEIPPICRIGERAIIKVTVLKGWLSELIISDFTTGFVHKTISLTGKATVYHKFSEMGMYRVTFRLFRPDGAGMFMSYNAQPITVFPKPFKREDAGSATDLW